MWWLENLLDILLGSLAFLLFAVIRKKCEANKRRAIVFKYDMLKQLVGFYVHCILNLILHYDSLSIYFFDFIFQIVCGFIFVKFIDLLSMKSYAVFFTISKTGNYLDNKKNYINAEINSTLNSSLCSRYDFDDIPKRKIFLYQLFLWVLNIISVKLFVFLVIKPNINFMCNFDEFMNKFMVLFSFLFNLIKFICMDYVLKYSMEYEYLLSTP